MPGNFSGGSFSSGSFSVDEQQEELRGRKRRRRGKIRIYREPEPEVEVLDVSEIAKEFSERLVTAGQELARAKLDLRAAQQRAALAGSNLEALAQAEARVFNIEQEIERIKEEEELVIVLSLSI